MSLNMTVIKMDGHVNNHFQIKRKKNFNSKRSNLLFDCFSFATLDNIVETKMFNQVYQILKMQRLNNKG